MIFFFKIMIGQNRFSVRHSRPHEMFRTNKIYFLISFLRLVIKIKKKKTRDHVQNMGRLPFRVSRIERLCECCTMDEKKKL